MVYKFKKMISALLDMQISLKINFLLMLLFGSVLVSGYISINQLRVFNNDAVTINNFGIIRGSIQRVSKLSLISNDNEQFIKDIDRLIGIEKSGDFLSVSNISSEDEMIFRKEIKSLEESWGQLKKIIYKPSERNSKFLEQVHQVSEICWENANKVVFRAQKISEAKLTNYREMLFKILVLLGVFILIIIALVYIVIHQKLEVEVITDSLTKIFNRNYFDKILAKNRSLSLRYNSTFSLLIVDVDYFKSVNDDFGHQKGDAILISLSELLLNNSRENDYVFRIGGEEFALILPHITNKSAEKLAEKYRKQISQYDFKLGRKLTVSIGVSEYAKDESVEALFRRVDNALFQAKSHGRNKVISITA